MSTTIAKYINLIELTPDLNYETEKELIQKAQEGNAQAKNSLFSAYLKLVFSIANRYEVQNIKKEDLIQEGVLGLEDALKAFDLSRNLRFSAPAKWWVKARIMKYVRENIRGFSIPPDASSKILHVSQSIERLKKEIGETPSNKEVGDELGFAESHVSFLRKFLIPSVSLNDMLGSGEEGGQQVSIQDLLHDDRNNAQESLIRDDGVCCIKKAMGFLPKTHRKVIEDRYGLEGDSKTLQEIGKELGVTSERVRQIQRAAEKKLLDWMNE